MLYVAVVDTPFFPYRKCPNLSPDFPNAYVIPYLNSPTSGVKHEIEYFIMISMKPLSNRN